MGEQKLKGKDGRRLPGGSKQLFYKDEDLTNVPRRAGEIAKMIDLRPTDHVLDAGCAEGLLTLELAKYVEHIHGFDLSAARIAEATRLAEERGITNATFEVESVIGYPAEPLSYDVTMFVGVWSSQGVGFAELDRLLKATRRQLLAGIRVTGIRPEEFRSRVSPMFEICDRNGFDVLCFSVKWVIAVRRGTTVHIPELPAVAVVPTTFLAEHPIVRNAKTIEHLEFDEEDSSGLPPE